MKKGLVSGATLHTPDQLRRASSFLDGGYCRSVPVDYVAGLIGTYGPQRSYPFAWLVITYCIAPQVNVVKAYCTTIWCIQPVETWYESGGYRGDK